MKRSAECPDEGARPGSDVLGVALLYNIGRTQFGSGEDRRASDRQEVASVALVDTSRWNEPSLGIRAEKLLHVARPPDARRKQLDGAGSGVDCGSDLGRGERAEEDRGALAIGDLHELWATRRRDDERCAGLDRGGCLISGHDRSGADDRVTLGGRADGVEDVGDRERELDAPHAACNKGFRQSERIGDVRRSHDGHDPIGPHRFHDIRHRRRIAIGEGSVLRTTIFTAEGGRVEASVAERPAWRPFEEFDGKPLRDVKLFEIAEVPGAELQMVEIAAGGHFAMHTSPDVAFCQVIRGRGKLVLPEGRELDYSGPELYIFHPGSYHEWRDIDEGTVLSVCLVKQPRGDAGS